MVIVPVTFKTKSALSRCKSRQTLSKISAMYVSVVHSMGKCFVLKFSSVKCTVTVLVAPLRAAACVAGIAGASASALASLRVAVGAKEGPVMGFRKLFARMGI